MTSDTDTAADDDVLFLTAAQTRAEARRAKVRSAAKARQTKVKTRRAFLDAAVAVLCRLTDRPYVRRKAKPKMRDEERPKTQAVVLAAAAIRREGQAGRKTDRALVSEVYKARRQARRKAKLAAKRAKEREALKRAERLALLADVSDRLRNRRA